MLCCCIADLADFIGHVVVDLRTFNQLKAVVQNVLVFSIVIVFNQDWLDRLHWVEVIREGY